MTEQYPQLELAKQKRYWNVKVENEILDKLLGLQKQRGK